MFFKGGIFIARDESDREEGRMVSHMNKDGDQRYREAFDKPQTELRGKNAIKQMIRWRHQHVPPV